MANFNISGGAKFGKYFIQENRVVDGKLQIDKFGTTIDLPQCFNRNGEISFSSDCLIYVDQDAYSTYSGITATKAILINDGLPFYVSGDEIYIGIVLHSDYNTDFSQTYTDIKYSYVGYELWTCENDGSLIQYLGMEYALISDISLLNPAPIFNYLVFVENQGVQEWQISIAGSGDINTPVWSSKSTYELGGIVNIVSRKYQQFPFLFDLNVKYPDYSDISSGTGDYTSKSDIIDLPC